MGKKVRHIIGDKLLCKKIVSMQTWAFSMLEKEVEEYIKWAKKNVDDAPPICKKCKSVYDKSISV